MQVLSRNRALGALACVLTAAFAILPTRADAQTTPGTVLFWRPMSGMVDGFKTRTGSALFSIGDDGFNERQLTTYAEGVFNMPAIASYESLWLTNAFSPSGRYSIYLEAHSTLPHYEDTAYHGKYFIMNARGERVGPLFYGSDDLEKPADGPGYGSVTWGPAGTNEIAYANAPDNRPSKHPACIRLMHPDGTGDHKLWCASRWYYRGIEAIRWSGDGRSLLAYAVRSDRFPNPAADLYLIDTATGAATLVEATVRAPYAGWGVGDISYDGHEVVYGVVYETHDPGPCNEPDGVGVVWCARNLLTGQTVPLTDPDNMVRFGLQPQALISPDGSEVYLVGTINPGATNPEAEIYALKTDGTAQRKITSPCVAMDDATSLWWRLVRLSPDGKQMLANCHSEHYPPAPVVRKNKIMVVDLMSGSARFVTHGVAYDWHAPSL
jgi:hypothetical protein